MRRAPLFADLSPAELELVGRHVDELTVPAGTRLMEQGHSGHEFVVLLEGEAVVDREGETVRTLRAGDFAGEIALLTGRSRTANVTTTTEAHLLVIEEQGFARALEQSPGLTLKLIRGLGEHVGPYLAA